MPPFQRNLYRLGLVAVIAAGAVGSIILAVGSPQPGGIRVEPPPKSALASPAPGGASARAGQELLDLNQASRVELESLPRIGEVLADRIVQYRADKGPFLRVDHIMSVRGIGPTTYEAIRGFVMVGPP